VVEEKPSAATAIAAQPIQPRTKRAEEGRRRATAGAARASAAPSASSQARAKVEKYADAGLALVAWIDHARETPAIADSRSRTGGRCEPATARVPKTINANSAGQTR